MYKPQIDKLEERISILTKQDIEIQQELETINNYKSMEPISDECLRVRDRTELAQFAANGNVAVHPQFDSKLLGLPQCCELAFRYGNLDFTIAIARQHLDRRHPRSGQHHPGGAEHSPGTYHQTAWDRVRDSHPEVRR